LCSRSEESTEVSQSSFGIVFREAASSIAEAAAATDAPCLKQWRSELAEIAGIAAEIESSLRRARESMYALVLTLHLDRRAERGRQPGFARAPRAPSWR
jgi:hypothetical protein